MNNVAQLLDAKALLAEDEPLMRRALSVAEASLGTDHPEVAIRLNNLAALLLATNRLADAEPLMRRALAIFFAFETQTGHAHPHRDTVSGNYTALLAAMGRREAAIGEAITALRREAGLPAVDATSANAAPRRPEKRSVFRLLRSIAGFPWRAARRRR